MVLHRWFQSIQLIFDVAVAVPRRSSPPRKERECRLSSVPHRNDVSFSLPPPKIHGAPTTNERKLFGSFHDCLSFRCRHSSHCRKRSEKDTARNTLDRQAATTPLQQSHLEIYNRDQRKVSSTRENENVHLSQRNSLGHERQPIMYLRNATKTEAVLLFLAG